MDVNTLSLRREGALILLPPKVFDTLVVLVQHRGDVVSKEQLLKLVWRDAYVEENNLAQNIFILRRKLGKTREGGEYIQTISKRGYRISVPVQEVATTIQRVDSVAITNEVMADAVGQNRLYWWRRIGLAVLAAMAGTGYLEWLQHTPPIHVIASRFAQITNQMAVKIGYERQPSIVTDGSHIYFTGGNTVSQGLFRVSASGGEASPIRVSFAKPEILDFSAARSELLVLASSQMAIDGPLWSVPVRGGAARRVGDLEATDACWSPDGRSIAFTSGKQLYRSDVSGKDILKLAELPGILSKPRWSPDGRSLRLTVVDIGGATNSSIWEVAANGGGPHQLLQNWSKQANECCGNWTRDGRHYLFQATRENRTQIWSLDSTHIFDIFPRAANKPEQVTTGEMNFAAPVASPDSSKIFMVGQQPRGELNHYDSKSQQFVPYLGGISADWIDFSRDGKWMTYSLFPDGTLWRSKKDGSQRVQLTFPPTRVLSPLWAPDGKRILFYDVGTLRPRLSIVSADGGKPALISGSNGFEMSVTWSPDGNYIMFSDFPFLLRNPQEAAIHLLDLRSSHRVTLPGSGGLFGPVWSPNGRYAAAQTVHGSGIMLFDFRRHNWLRIAEGTDFFRWSKDSRFLFFIRHGGHAAIMKIQVSDGEVQEVADVSGMHLAGILPGIQYSLAPDDAPVVLKDTGVQEIYSASLRFQ